MREPTNHYGGYAWTFSKGNPEKGETPEQTALREVGQETGVIGKIEGRIPGEFQGTTGTTIFFLMSVVRDTGRFDSETAGVKWASRAEAEELIKITPSRIGRQRDLKVLEAAFRCWTGR